MKVLVTGAAGFIGAALSHRLLDAGNDVVGVDNLNDYYDVRLKQSRLDRLLPRKGFRNVRLDIVDRDRMADLFAEEKFDTVVHLAAQAGVRYSLENPNAYIDSNVVGFMNVLEGCRHSKTGHLVFASSSSVYGANTRLPFSEHDTVDHPVSLYAATKKANELMAHTYAHLYGLPCTGLRFFTVYGPWGRPDMALFKFTQGILDGKPIQVFNRGEMVRDFTYVDDIIEGMVRVVASPARSNPGWNGDRPDPATSYAPWRIFNIGNNQPVNLMRYIEVLEASIGRKATIEFKPMQPGDVKATMADTGDLERAVGFRPGTSVETGIARFVDWYRDYYRVESTGRHR
ncbi:MAG TPA: NAD-dependent epimerase [Burkholderiales bacterium]|nr:NAD-dependent epimerase [Burkholderiales bacterium]